MKPTNGIILLLVFLAVFISGCDNKSAESTALLTDRASYDLDPENTAWLHGYLPEETVAYVNIPTPWNYLFDAKADALHAVQSLAAHKEQVNKIKQGAKENYFKYIPAHYQGMASLLLEHMKTSLEVAVINNAPSALLPTIAVGTRLEGLSSEQLAEQLTSVLQMVGPGITLEQQDNQPVWTFLAGQFPAFVQYDENNGRLLIYGGMGANKEKFDALWNQPKADQLQQIKAMNQKADPSGLNMKMWVAAAKLYQMGQAFVPPADQQKITQFGLDQMDYIWFGSESAQGQSALALHVMMPETGWRLALPRSGEWFDVKLAGKPRSVMQFTLPTSAQLKQGIAHFELDQKLTAQDNKDMQVWRDLSEQVGFDFYDWLDAYYQQILYVKDDSGSWFAMKIKDQALNDKLEKGIYDFLKIQPQKNQLEGVEIEHMHFSFYKEFFLAQSDKPNDADKIEAFLNMFKDHVYWYIEDDVFYMSQIPQVLAAKKRHPNSLYLSEWLEKNQGHNWDSAIFAYGKDVKHLPQDLYHFYLMLLQGLGDLAQTEVDLFTLPTAESLNLPEQGRINLVLSSDAEKVSFRFGYEYSVLEPIMTAEGGLAAVAVLGIMAAYAVPAYHDYTIRAKIGEQLAMSAVVKQAAGEQYMSTGNFAGVNESVELYADNISFDEETGLITINLADVDSRFGEYDEIYIEPMTDNGYLEWYCYSNIKTAYLPVSCRE